VAQNCKSRVLEESGEPRFRFLSQNTGVGDAQVPKVDVLVESGEPRSLFLSHFTGVREKKRSTNLKMSV